MDNIEQMKIQEDYKELLRAILSQNDRILQINTDIAHMLCNPVYMIVQKDHDVKLS